MIDDSQFYEIGKIVASVGAGVVTAIWGRSWVRNRTSRDTLLIARDKAEIGIVERLQIENSAFRMEIAQASAERNEAVSLRGRLEERIVALTDQLTAARSSLEEARRRIEALDAEITSVRAMLQRALNLPVDRKP